MTGVRRIRDWLDDPHRCIVCGHTVRIRRDGRYGAHTIGRQRFPCNAAGRVAPTGQRVRVRVMYRFSLTQIGHADDIVRWDGPGHKTVDLLYQGGELGEYITRFDRRDPDLIATDGLMRRYLFPAEPYPGAGEVIHGAWAAYVFYYDKTIVGNRIVSRRRQLEQELGAAAAHDFALAP